MINFGFQKKGSQVQAAAAEFDAADLPDLEAPTATALGFDAPQAREVAEGEEQAKGPETLQYPDPPAPLETVPEVVQLGETVQAVQEQQVALDQLNEQEFKELHLSVEHSHALRSSWNIWLNAHSSEVIGDAIYGAFQDAAPTLRDMWKQPRGLLSARMFQTFRDLVAKIDTPAALKDRVEMLAFVHLQIDVTAPRVWLFRDALIELLQVEEGEQFGSIHREAWSLLMSYIGGAFIFVRQQYARRLQVLLSSWSKVSIHDDDAEAADKVQDNSPQGGAPSDGSPSPSPEGFGHKKLKDMEDGRGHRRLGSASIPTTFKDMFVFSAAVMGFGRDSWMDDVLRAFDSIVSNIANPIRLQEECDVLSIILSKHKGPIILKDYKSVMLASLRGLLPQDWNSEYENAWCWLWESMERLLKVNMGKPFAAQEKALRSFVERFSEEERDVYRIQTYKVFFNECRQGQDYFKQSTTRMHFIADKVLTYTQDIFKDTSDVIDDLSALGLRHVGYGIPSELFEPFNRSVIQVITEMAKARAEESSAGHEWNSSKVDLVVEAFSWSLSLVSRILVRTMNEGSTLVMKAINTNDLRSLRKAVSCAPRGQRGQWVLQVQVGSQHISPLMWAIRCGALETAKAILQDVCTIRADRERYYYAVDELFDRHPDIVERLRRDAPTLLETLLTGLIWRSRQTQGGLRRVNYYVKHLIVENDGTLAQALASLVDHDDPVIMCHPTVVLVFDSIWTNVAMKAFLFNKLFFLASLVAFLLAESVLLRIPEVMRQQSGLNFIFVCRLWFYCLYLGSLLARHSKQMFTAIKEHDLVRVDRIPVPVPRYLLDRQVFLSFILMLGLAVMCIFEPAWRCSPGHFNFQSSQGEARNIGYVYPVTAMCCNLVFAAMMMDLMVLSTSVSAYVLACGRVAFEVLLCMFALFFNVCTFSCIICCMQQDMEDFSSVPSAMLTLTRITLGLYSAESLNEAASTPDLFVFVSIYTFLSYIFLLNMLIGQMNCIYMATYSDMLGFARLNRGRMLLRTMPSVKPKTWEAYVKSLRLDEKLEFNEGDIGFSGGLTCFEPANSHLVTEEQIKRYGGPTDEDAPWPEEAELAATDKTEQMLLAMQKNMGKIWRVVAGKNTSSSGGTAHGTSSVSHSQGRGSHTNSSADEM